MERNHLQALGIDEPREWSDARMWEATQFINNYLFELSVAATDWLLNEAPMFLMLLNLNSKAIQHASTDLCNLMLSIGYLKGYQRAMEDQILNKLLQ